MEFDLKTHYGKRTTPGVKVLMLIVVIVLGLYLVFSRAGQRAHTDSSNSTPIEILQIDQDS